MDIGFGISQKDGAFLLLSNGSEVKKSDVEDENVKDRHAGDDFNLKIIIIIRN